MSQQQPDFDSWTNCYQSLWGVKTALAVYRARTDVLGRGAVIIRALSLFEEAMSAPATPVRFFLNEVACS